MTEGVKRAVILHTLLTNRFCLKRLAYANELLLFDLNKLRLHRGVKQLFVNPFSLCVLAEHKASFPTKAWTPLSAVGKVLVKHIK